MPNRFQFHACAHKNNNKKNDVECIFIPEKTEDFEVILKYCDEDVWDLLENKLRNDIGELFAINMAVLHGEQKNWPVPTQQFQLGSEECCCYIHSRQQTSNHKSVQRTMGCIKFKECTKK